ncbi:hypothetical protein E2C01_065380 [Portunus trituberculatus]|uniref:Secreted protein n=1 Tax=Portunus trituberculatus TaxID=210409 RepID=A0A5B7HFG3_PORTR|nr:hypothetical protein [Portunus trituberculatus]
MSTVLRVRFLVFCCRVSVTARRGETRVVRVTVADTVGDDETRGTLRQSATRCEDSLDVGRVLLSHDAYDSVSSTTYSLTHSPPPPTFGQQAVGTVQRAGGCAARAEPLAGVAKGKGAVCTSGNTIGVGRVDRPPGGCSQKWRDPGAAAPLRAMYRLAWGAVQRGLTDALLGYAVALWKRSRPRLLPAPAPLSLEDDEDAFCGLHHRDCPCRGHPPPQQSLKVTPCPPPLRWTGQQALCSSLLLFFPGR